MVKNNGTRVLNGDVKLFRSPSVIYFKTAQRNVILPFTQAQAVTANIYYGHEARAKGFAAASAQAA